MSKQLQRHIFLANLPNELLVKIISDSRPLGFEGLVLSCKHFYHLATTFGLVTAYNELKRRWEIWEPILPHSYAGFHRHYQNTEDDHPLTRLVAIHENPRIVEYMRVVRLPENLQLPIRNHGPDYYESQYVVDKSSTLPVQKLDDIILSSIIPDISVEFMAWEDWIYEYKVCPDNDMRPLIMLILTLLPYVTRMRLSCQWPCNEDRQRPLELDILSLLHTFHKPGTCRGLSRLTEIEPWRVASPAGCNLSCLLHVLPIPSLRKVSAAHLRADIDSQPYRRHCKDDCPSDVEQIELTASYIEPYRLEAFLKPCRNLRIFKYEHGVFEHEAGKHWDARSFVEMLCESPAAETLEELSLSTSSIDVKVTAPELFKELKRLRSLELHIDFLYPPSSRRFYTLSSEDEPPSAPTSPHASPTQGIERLLEIVPPSLSKLSLVFMPLRDWRPKLFRDLALQWRENLSLLNHLQVTASHTNCLKVDAETMRRDIEAVGVDCELDVTIWGFAKHTRHITHDLDLRTIRF